MADDGSQKPTVRFEGGYVDQPTAAGPIEVYVGGVPIPTNDATCETPARIGRYRVEKILGQGGFGLVYLAIDEQLNRPVAVKIPYRELLKKPEDADPYLAEARMVASLDHPNIVPVLDVGSTPEFPCFVVSKFIDGITLSRKIRTAPPTAVETAELVATIADALHYAHSQDIVHRDVKPGNVLLDKQWKPHLVDFGLALNDRNGADTYSYAGTPSYMSPEQARGEGHLVDGRADIFGLGVVLYEMLTGTRPFHGMTSGDLMRAVVTQEPRPLRQRNDKIPRELERICLQALSKQVSDRHLTAKDFADDLRTFLARKKSDPQESRDNQVATHDSSPADSERLNSAAITAGSESKLVSPRVVPKGLRSFDGDDEEFFLGLLPGPRDRQGLPHSVRFWKSRLEDDASTKPLRVGVVYGPSGCGKSSFVSAGLLPRLDRSVVPVVVAATPDGTERRLIEQLRPYLPDGNEVPALSTAFQRLRLRQHAPRVLVVIDQFEQWLHANDSSSDCELVQALRQCDGKHIACLIIVRDDFWMSVVRFFKQLDIPLAERENSAAIDLFDKRHARAVLHAFGHAYGTLPERMDELSPDQNEFLTRAIDELAENDRVICVRLTLFAQMMSNRDWKPATLDAVGGASGVGVTFLEESFNSTTAPMAYRAHHAAIRSVLKALLPAPGTEIKASSQTLEELSVAAGYQSWVHEMQPLMQILHDETRLLTPVDPQGASAAGQPAGQRSYQLTHDYLVGSIREWLTRRQRETWRGRAELRLEERTALWSSRREYRQLPTMWETWAILTGTKRREWTVKQREMMRYALRQFQRRVLTAGLLLVVGVLTALTARRLQREGARIRQAEGEVARLLDAAPSRVPDVLREMEGTRDVWTKRLEKLAADPQAPHSHQLRANLGLSLRDANRIGPLVRSLLDDDHETIRAVRDAYSGQPGRLAAAARVLARDPKLRPKQRLRAAALLTQPNDPQSTDDWSEIGNEVVAALVNDNSLDVDNWADLLLEARERLLPACIRRFADHKADSSQRLTAARILARFASTESLSELILQAESAEYPVLFQALKRDRDRATKHLEHNLNRVRELAPQDVPNRTRQLRNAALTLLRFHRDDLFWPWLKASPDLSVRTALILSLRELGVAVDEIWRAEATLSDPQERQALWLGLGTYDPRDVSGALRDEIVARACERFRNAEFQAERSGAEWLLNQWGKGAERRAIQATLAGARGRDWYVTSQGHAMLVVSQPRQFRMGSPPEERRREIIETPHERLIAHPFAISIHEVTLAQYLQFDPNPLVDRIVSSRDECPMNDVSWFGAARYCRWLSDQPAEGIAPEQRCYLPGGETNTQMPLPAEILNRGGYRLPTEAEWEYVCRAGTKTRYFWGEDDAGRSRFGWWIANSDEVCWPVGSLMPNPWGLFDLTGNVSEWCHDLYQDYPTSPGETVFPNGVPESGATSDHERVVRGGSFRSGERALRPAQRYPFAPGANLSTIGFRIVRTLRDN